VVVAVRFLVLVVGYGWRERRAKALTGPALDHHAA
jgi:hypothetical protein